MLIRLCYASNRIDHQDLLKDLSDLLATSIRRNRANNVCGVLYYARGSFFQCLEGEKADVEKLFNCISQDTRHTNVKILSQETILETTFHDWSMKYVQEKKEIDLFFKERNYPFFQPTELKEYEVDGLLKILLTKENSVINKSDEDNQQQSPKGYRRGYSGYLSS
ncbi:BLUF domain-containing protein [Acinetobacter apis]|uniref:Sensors of blue-light using FAD n=1 Tax=Acinetobacter apis TaxID=1229165 RepID=A0A217EDF8_9GAMM|nr:BLUF domain-containing protein [Acinetobacter apis]SNQ28226.1 Sensors of blue-light using FAD [Acinetobacter apis]